MGNVFKFKQFQVDQSGCAMKINTDGVLLGALATQSAPASILDIGTGTGVIAMMLAQRFTDAWVDAVEIDEMAAQTAALNLSNSIFFSRSAVHHSDISTYKTDRKYDLILSNPPYFVNDLKNQEKRKGIARHTDEFFFNMLLERAASLLTEVGFLWLILPVKQANWVVTQAVLYRLFPNRILHIHSDEEKPEFRQIVCLSFRSAKPVHEYLYIYKSRGVYTDGYKTLLKDFFLNF